MELFNRPITQLILVMKEYPKPTKNITRQSHNNESFETRLSMRLLSETQTDLQRKRIEYKPTHARDLFALLPQAFVAVEKPNKMAD